MFPDYRRVRKSIYIYKMLFGTSMTVYSNSLFQIVVLKKGSSKIVSCNLCPIWMSSPAKGNKTNVMFTGKRLGMQRRGDSGESPRLWNLVF